MLYSNSGLKLLMKDSTRFRVWEGRHGYTRFQVISNGQGIQRRIHPRHSWKVCCGRRIGRRFIHELAELSSFCNQACSCKRFSTMSRRKKTSSLTPATWGDNINQQQLVCRQIAVSKM